MQNSRGFTLVEMLVSLAVFGVVMLIAIGALVSIVDANRKARAQKSVLNNLNATVETMVRSVREGSDYSIPSSNRLQFTDSLGRTVLYSLVAGEVLRSIDGATGVAITSPDTVVDNLEFEFVDNTGISDPVPKVQITISGRTGVGDDRIESEFNIQSLVSERYFVTSATPPSTVTGTEPNIVCPFEPAAGRTIVNLAEVKTYNDTLRACTSCTTSWEDYNYSPSINIPAGTYELKLAGYDEHCGDGYYNGHGYPEDTNTGGLTEIPSGSGNWYHPSNPPDTVVQNDPGLPGYECEDDQINEQFYIRIYDDSGGFGEELRYESDVSVDLPQSVNVIADPAVVDTITVPDDLLVTLPTDLNINRIRAIHIKDHVVYGPPISGSHSLFAACIAFDQVSGGGGSPINVDINPF